VALVTAVPILLRSLVIGNTCRHRHTAGIRILVSVIDIDTFIHRLVIGFKSIPSLSPSASIRRSRLLLRTPNRSPSSRERLDPSHFVLTISNPRCDLLRRIDPPLIRSHRHTADPSCGIDPSSITVP